jgi:hypothetical protein
MNTEKRGASMAQTQTTFDALMRLAHDLDIGFISGPLQPPAGGRLFLGARSLADLLLPSLANQLVAIGILAGGPGAERVSLGKTALSADSAARLVDAVEEAGGHLYQGRLALLTPEEWLRRRGNAPAPHDAPYDLPGPGTWSDNRENAQLAGMGAGELMDTARAAGWPSTFADEPVLFLGDEPLYYLLMRENVGRVVTLLIGAVETRER